MMKWCENVQYNSTESAHSNRKNIGELYGFLNTIVQLLSVFPNGDVSRHMNDFKWALDVVFLSGIVLISRQVLTK